MKVRNLLIFAVTYILSSLAIASEPEGWQNTYWGMPIDSIKKEYGIIEGTKKNDYGVDTLTVSDYEVFDIPFTVTFLFRDGSTLSSVILMAITSTDLTDEQTKLIHALNSKYGEGIVEKEQKMERTTTMHDGKGINFPGMSLTNIVWSTASTVISYTGSITVTALPKTEYSSWISINYERNDGDKL